MEHNNIVGIMQNHDMEPMAQQMVVTHAAGMRVYLTQAHNMQQESTA
jgi:hypothetical protein